MKTINIQKKVIRQIPKQVCLGNGQRISFSSKRVAGRFIADTNRYLTKCLVVLNNSYIELFREYRQLWFVTTNSNQGKTTYYGSFERSIKGSLGDADRLFDKFNSTQWGSNDPYFAFIDLRKIALFLGDAARNMAAFHKKRNYTGNYHSCQVLADRMDLVIHNLDEYSYVN